MMNNLVTADSTYKVALPHLQIKATTASSNDGEKILAHLLYVDVSTSPSANKSQNEWVDFY
ncbi:MAG: hypothetical protein M3044_21215 [Thermoproteota archaeon]|nr:hypothetical protein [Thermoproteota archaeon]